MDDLNLFHNTILLVTQNKGNFDPFTQHVYDVMSSSMLQRFANANLKIRLSESCYYCSSVTLRVPPRPERPKGSKDEVKGPEGPPASSRGQEGP